MTEYHDKVIAITESTILPIIAHDSGVPVMIITHDICSISDGDIDHILTSVLCSPVDVC